jgi:coenzyme F420-reducing hydrogenase delta subunit
MAKKRFEFLRDALPILGLEPERLRLEWISAAEGEKFAAVIRGYTAEIEKLGPSPLHRYQEEARG